jgi:hypothetical protein
VAERAPAGVEGKNPGVKGSLDIRRIPAVDNIIRLPNPNAQQPTGGFWPALKPDDLTAWQVGDPERIDMDRDGVTLSAGPGGNLLLTKKGDYKGCTLKITLSAARGTEAFLALRAHRGPDDRWRGITARVYDEKSRIHVGHVSTDFQPPTRRQAMEIVDAGTPLRIAFQINSAGATNLVAKRGVSSMDNSQTLAGRYAGAAGVFVKSGTLTIHHMDVQE